MIYFFHTRVNFLKKSADTCCIFGIPVRGDQLVQRKKSDIIERRSRNPLSGTPARVLLFLRCSCWNCWRSARVRWWLHYGSSFLGAWGSSTGMSLHGILSHSWLEHINYCLKHSPKIQIWTSCLSLYAGLKCDSHLRNAFLLIHVRRGILPPQKVSCPIR